MQPGEAAAAAPLTEDAVGDRQHALYVYCVADGGQEAKLGPIGIDGCEVYSVPHRDLCAVVHDCLAEPYQSTDPQVVQGWVMSHQGAVNAAWERWGTVLPLAFDTIVKGQGEGGPQESIEAWLDGEYESLRRKIEAMHGRAEYVVQVFWDPRAAASYIAAKSEEITRLEEEIRCKPRGTAYLLGQKMERALRREMETRASECFRDFYRRIGQHVCDLKVERTKKIDGDRQMIMNLSCLLQKESSAELGKELQGIDGTDGFSVRFTGPWPPYSFVSG